MQGCAKKIKMNYKKKKTNAYGNNFMVIMVRGTSLKDRIGRMGKRIEMIIARMIYDNIKV